MPLLKTEYRSRSDTESSALPRCVGGAERELEFRVTKATCGNIVVHERGRNKADEWRAAWAGAANAELKRLGFDSRIDHRSYEQQGIEQIPTVHMGVAATQMERKGIRTERGDRNREIAITNQQMRQLKARINKKKDWIYAQPLFDAPTMLDMVNAIAV